MREKITPKINKAAKLPESVEQERGAQLPSFLYQSDPIYQDEGRIVMGLLPDSDVTEAYMGYLKSVQKTANNLPRFFTSLRERFIRVSLKILTSLTNGMNG